LSREDAENYIAVQDRDRDEFVRHYFHKNACDPLFYDLVINMQFVSPAEAGELILKLCCMRFGEELERLKRKC